MIFGIGVDAVEVDRFKFWLSFSKEQLLRVFSSSELEDIFSATARSATEKSTTEGSATEGSTTEGSTTEGSAMQRMACRYAAKEAFYKALSAMLVKLKKTQRTIPFLSVCRVVSIAAGQWDVPTLIVDWKFLEEKLMSKIPEVEINLSLSHEKNYAIAYVIIQEKKSKEVSCGA